MKPIQSPKETIEALLNGASKFIVPIDKSCYNCQGYVEDSNDTDIWEDCRNPNSKYYYEAIGNVNNTLCDKWIPSKNIKSPLQIGDEFYVKEEFSYNNFYEDMVDIFYPHTRTTKSIKYIDGYGILDNIRSDHKCTTDEAKQVEFSTSQMTPEQSRIKGKVVNVEVKRLQDISIDELKSLGITQDMAFEYNSWKPSYNDPDSGGRADYETAFYYWYNYQFNNYDENPYVFIVTIPNKTN